MGLNIFGGKSWYKSLTAWGTILFGAVQAAESIGAVPPGASATGATLLKILGEVLVVLGIRRAR